MNLYAFARAGLFALDPERAHGVTLGSLETAARLGLPRLWPAPPPAPVRVLGIDFANPVGLAAGLDKDGVAIRGLAALGFGFLEIGTVTPRPQAGNPQPRMFRLPARQALINRMGFNNAGVESLVGRLQRLRAEGVLERSVTAGSPPVRLGINIGKNKDTPADKAADDYRFCLGRVYPHADYLVLNLSSPNTPGLRDLQYGRDFEALLAAVLEERERCAQRDGRKVPMAVKIAPDMADDDVDGVIDTLARFGVEGVVATNTTTTRPDVQGLPHAGETGGLSGAPLGTLADHVLARVHRAAAGRLAIIGVGGVVDGAGAARKRALGADLVQVYSGLIYRGPALIAEAVAAWQRAVPPATA